MPAPLKLSSLPLFPLGTVLFPGGLLPLRIFEVRYLDMIGKCHKAGAPFGVVSLTQGAEVRRPGATAEEFSAVGTLATIESFSQVQPGLLAIRCSGAQRFRIARRELLKHGLWIADVERIEPDAAVPVPDDLRSAADALRQVAETLQQQATPGHTPMPSPWQLDDCGWVANRWCELLPLPVTMKQQLMELDNPLLRLELVGDFLSRSRIAPASPDAGPLPSP